MMEEGILQPATKRPGAGRPPIPMTELKMNAICESLKGGNTRECSAIAAGISVDTFMRWLENSPDFASRVARAESECEQKMVKILTDAATKDYRASVEWLKRRKKGSWSEKTETELSVSPDAPFVIQVVKGVTTDDL